MAEKLYEIRLLKQGESVHNVSPWLANIDLGASDLLPGVLNLHLYGAVGRAKALIGDAHLYSLTVHEVTGDQRGYGPPVITWGIAARDGDVMVLASEKAVPSQVKSARKRETWHMEQINGCASSRARVSRVAGWITAELNEMAPDGRAAVVDELLSIAVRLNRRNGGRDDRP